jgi:hypothetical protein
MKCKNCKSKFTALTNSTRPGKLCIDCEARDFQHFLDENQKEVDRWPESMKRNADYLFEHNYFDKDKK